MILDDLDESFVPVKAVKFSIFLVLIILTFIIFTRNEGKKQIPRRPQQKKTRNTKAATTVKKTSNRKVSFAGVFLCILQVSVNSLTGDKDE